MDQVEEIKQKIDIVSLIGEYVPLKKAGRNWKANCPFHGEKTPSFMVSPELGIFKCFGCQKAGDCFTFLMEYEGMEFREALKFLADKTGVKLTSYHPGEETEKEKLFKLNQQAAYFYHYVLLNHSAGKTALNYLTAERGLEIATIKTFQIGYAPDVPDVLKKFLVDKNKFTTADLEKAGFGFYKNSVFIDKFRDRVTFPLFDHRGNVVGFSGRIMPGQNKDLAKYINSPETPIYHKSRLLYGLNLTKGEIKLVKEAVVVEGELDLISPWQRGIKNIVAIKGSAVTEDQGKLLSRFAGKVTLALDSDFAGNVAARRGIAVIQKLGLEIRVAKFERYKDPDDAARGDLDYFQKSLSNAVGVWDFIIDSVFANAGTGGEDKAKLSREIVPVLSSIDDEIVRAHYVGVVAKKLGVHQEAVLGQLEKYLNQKGSEEQQKTVAGPVKVERDRRDLLEERLLAILFQTDSKKFIKKYAKLFNSAICKRIIEEYQKYTENQPEFNLSEFSAGLPKEILAGFSELVLKDLGEAVESQEKLEAEIGLIADYLKLFDLKQKLAELGREIKKYEEAGEEEKLKTVQEKFAEIGKKIHELEEAKKQGIILQEE